MFRSVEASATKTSALCRRLLFRVDKKVALRLLKQETVEKREENIFCKFNNFCP